jgi:hypothetical protein
MAYSSAYAPSPPPRPLWTEVATFNQSVARGERARNFPWRTRDQVSSVPVDPGNGNPKG